MVAGGDEGEGEGYQKRDDVICADQMVLPKSFDMNDSLQQSLCVLHYPTCGSSPVMHSIVRHGAARCEEAQDAHSLHLGYA